MNDNGITCGGRPATMEDYLALGVTDGSYVGRKAIAALVYEPARDGEAVGAEAIQGITFTADKLVSHGATIAQAQAYAAAAYEEFKRRLELYKEAVQP